VRPRRLGLTATDLSHPGALAAPGCASLARSGGRTVPRANIREPSEGSEAVVEEVKLAVEARWAGPTANSKAAGLKRQGGLSSAEEGRSERGGLCQPPLQV
jgi:hypothetical protein